MKKYKVVSLLLALVIFICSTLFSGCQHEHDYGKWKTSKEPTCTEEGTESRTCDCGEKDKRTIPAVGHTYESEITKEANCAENGIKTFTCKNCDDEYTEDVVFKEYTSTEIYDMYVNSVGEVVTYDKSGKEFALGSCFVYDDKGSLMTNYHVIEGAYSIKVTFGEKTYDVVEISAYDKDIDLAVIKISASDLKPATLCDKDHSAGKTVYAFGNSKGLTSTFSNGIITYSNREMDGINYVQHNAPISSGNSGGPLINVHGEVIGVNTWTVRDSQNLNFAVHLSEIDNLDFKAPMTVKEYYEKECDVITKLKNHIIKNGKYDDDGDYWLDLGTSYSNDYTFSYSRYAIYDVENDNVDLAMMINEDSMAIVSLDNEVSGVYDWYYFDEEYEMYGILFAATLDSDTQLKYTSDNIYTSEMRNLINTLASKMVYLMCANITDDFEDIGVTAKDLGFLNF